MPCIACANANPARDILSSTLYKIYGGYRLVLHCIDVKKKLRHY